MIGHPVAGFVAFNNLEYSDQRRIGANDAVAQQYFDLLHAALFGQHDHAAQLFKQFRSDDDCVGVQIVDGAAENPLDKAINMAAGAIHRERQCAAQSHRPGTGW